MTVSKRTVGKMTVGEMTVGKMTVGKMTVGKMTVGKMTVGKMTRSQTDETSRESIFGLTTSLSGRIPFKETFQRKKERKKNFLTSFSTKRTGTVRNLVRCNGTVGQRNLTQVVNSFT